MNIPITEQPPYEIVENARGRRILVLTAWCFLSREEDLSYESFDAIFVNDKESRTVEMMMSVINNVHPLSNAICELKPIFVATRLQPLMNNLTCLIDGYANDPLEQAIADKIEEIYARIRELGLAVVDYGRNTVEAYLSKQLRFMLSRDMRTITPILLEGSTSGYTSPFSQIYEKGGVMTYAKRLFIYQRLLELDYLKVKRFIDKVYVCPDCMHSHLLYIESCPKCGNSDIEQEAMIHHFRCANISPEHTYMKDGQMCCPKCGRYLRHIGVDYDRPADLYMCHTCRNHFTYPHIKVICTKCKKTYSTNELVPVNIYEYEFTQKGIRALVSNELYLTIQNSFSTGFVPFNEFAADLRMLPTVQTRENVQSIITGRFWIFDKTGSPVHIGLEHVLMRYVYNEFNNYKISNDGHIIYVFQLVPHDQEQTRRLRTEEKMSRIADHTFALHQKDWTPRYEVQAEDVKEIDALFVRELSILPPP